MPTNTDENGPLDNEQHECSPLSKVPIYVKFTDVMEYIDKAKNKSDDEHFCLSLIQSFQQLDPSRKCEVKIAILSVLHKALPQPPLQQLQPQQEASYSYFYESPFTMNQNLDLNEQHQQLPHQQQHQSDIVLPINNMSSE